MRIAIVGGGFTGLTIGYYLSLKDYQVTIFEKNSLLGGLAAGFRAGSWYLEHFFHHIFKTDLEIQKLVKDLGFNNLWIWKDCGAPIYYQGKVYPFTTALDLLRFSPLTLANRLRTGLVSLYLMTIRNHQNFKREKASSWLKKWMGQQSWQVIWQPLMKKKFGSLYDQVSMSWMWARIHKRSRFLGYPKGGFQVIIDKLANQIKQNGGIIKLDQKIRNLSQLKSFDKIIITCASPIFLKIAPQLPKNYQQKLKKIDYFGAIVVLLKLKTSLTNGIYWLNINDEKIPFVVCVQHSNFMNKKYYGNNHFVYLGTYLSRNNKLFKTADEKIIKEWSFYLSKINKNFKDSWIEDYWVFKEPFAQPIFKVGSYQYIPDFKTPLKNVYLVNMTQIYPWDRGVNYAVGLGRRFIAEHF